MKLWNGTGSGGDAQGDTSPIENLIGSAGNDTLIEKRLRRRQHA
ncbi:MAG: hypothetical protein R3C25_01235 [Hyphomonadaceae bacterium]